MSRPLYIICGKSGTGKTTLINNLCHRNNLSSLISYTTRPRRTIVEDSHIFLEENEFEQIPDKFLEFTFLNYKYCITHAQIMDADIFGLPPNAFKELYKKQARINRTIKLIYIMVSDETRYARMQHRKDSMESINIRMDEEAVYFNGIEKYADKIVYNYDLGKCLEEIEMYIHDTQ